jgi:hypothetical protein
MTKHLGYDIKVRRSKQRITLNRQVGELQHAHAKNHNYDSSKTEVEEGDWARKAIGIRDGNVDGEIN